MDIQEELQRTLKTVQAPSLNNRFQSRMIRTGKKIYKDYTLPAQHIANKGGQHGLIALGKIKKIVKVQFVHAKNDLVAFN